uniref:Purine permease 1-like n=1 Tax=Nicotiana tabacum TaxID=4097 RepID=A0A1S4AUG9_TOBAC|nr:PREDICTED: purine permease 1-like [Nicotiana tabacum]
MAIVDQIPSASRETTIYSATYFTCIIACKRKYKKIKETIVAAALGILYVLQCYCSTLGSSLLPVSTSTLLASTQFPFADLFAYVIVKQKITVYRTNAIVLLTLGAGILAVRVNGDRSTGESIKMYFLGFMMSLSAAALYGIVPPLLELTYTKAKKAVTYPMVLEMQMIMCFSANVFCTVAMIINKDFQSYTSV